MHRKVHFSRGLYLLAAAAFFVVCAPASTSALKISGQTKVAAAAPAWVVEEIAFDAKSGDKNLMGANVTLSPNGKVALFVFENADQNELLQISGSTIKPVTWADGKPVTGERITLVAHGNPSYFEYQRKRGHDVVHMLMLIEVRDGVAKLVENKTEQRFKHFTDQCVLQSGSLVIAVQAEDTGAQYLAKVKDGVIELMKDKDGNPCAGDTLEFQMHSNGVGFVYVKSGAAVSGLFLLRNGRIEKLGVQKGPDGGDPALGSVADIEAGADGLVYVWDSKTAWFVRNGKAEWINDESGKPLDGKNLAARWCDGKFYLSAVEQDAKGKAAARLYELRGNVAMAINWAKDARAGASLEIHDRGPLLKGKYVDGDKEEFRLFRLTVGGITPITLPDGSQAQLLDDEFGLNPPNDRRMARPDNEHASRYVTETENAFMHVRCLNKGARSIAQLDGGVLRPIAIGGEAITAKTDFHFMTYDDALILGITPGAKVDGARTLGWIDDDLKYQAFKTADGGAVAAEYMDIAKTPDGVYVMAAKKYGDPVHLWRIRHK